jgi:hypothetical protein
MVLFQSALRISCFCVAAVGGLGLMLASFSGRPAITSALLDELLGGDSSCWDIGTTDCTKPGGSCSTTPCTANPNIAKVWLCPGGYDYNQLVNPREICASVDTGFYNCYSAPDTGKNNGITTCWSQTKCYIAPYAQVTECVYSFELQAMACQVDPNAAPTSPVGSQYYRPLVGGSGCNSAG